MPGLHPCIYILSIPQTCTIVSVLTWPCLFTHCVLDTPLSWPSAHSYSRTFFRHFNSNLKQTSLECTSHCRAEMCINGDVLKSFWWVTRARIWAWVWRWKAGELAHCACPLHRLLGDNNFPKTCLMQPKKQWHRSSCVCFLSAGILLLQAPQCFGLQLYSSNHSSCSTRQAAYRRQLTIA